MNEQEHHPDADARADVSVLFPCGPPPAIDSTVQPDCFVDLNLDQVVAQVTAGKQEYRLTPLFHYPLRHVDDVIYRQEVFRDLERPEVWAAVTAFVQCHLASSSRYRADEMRHDRGDFSHYHRARHLLNAVDEYCAAVTDFVSELTRTAPASRGLQRLRLRLAEHVASESFGVMRTEARRLLNALDEVCYCIVVKGDKVTVGRYSDETDYGRQVTQTFARFRQDATRDDRDLRPDWREEDFAELGVLAMVAKLYPRLFAALDSFCQQHLDYLDGTVALADRELQFYLAYLDHIRPLRAAGLAVTYPAMSATSKHEQALDTFDLALAVRLTPRGDLVVCNDVTLRGTERILVISGPNNGGKTTLARTFGQVHYLAALGCPVPGRDVQLFLCDRIFTHFEQREDIDTLAGKLQEELDRLHADLAQATPASLLVLNEAFSSTTAADARFLNGKILDAIGNLGALGICVTFLDELSARNDTTVSMVSQVDPDDPSIRTHKVIRIPADGRAYARAIAVRYGLTYEQITARAVAP